MGEAGAEQESTGAHGSLGVGCIDGCGEACVTRRHQTSASTRANQASRLAEGERCDVVGRRMRHERLEGWLGLMLGPTARMIMQRCRKQRRYGCERHAHGHFRGP
jgi:hypothetical protein